MSTRQFETTVLALLLAGSVLFAPLAVGGIVSAPTPGDGGTMATLGDQESIAATLSLEPLPEGTASDTWTKPRGGNAPAELYVEIEPAHDHPDRLAIGQFAAGNWSLLTTKVVPGQSDNSTTVVRAGIPGDGRYGVFGPAVTDGNASATNATALLAFTVNVEEKPGGGPTIAAPSSVGGSPTHDDETSPETTIPGTVEPTTTDNRTGNGTSTGGNGTTVAGTPTPTPTPDQGTSTPTLTPTTTEEPTTTKEPTTTEEPTTTKEPTTTEESTTTEEPTTTEESTTTEEPTTTEPTTQESTTTEESSSTQTTSTEAPSTTAGTGS